MACTYRTITLQPGESYVLPAGAEIISATDSATITSVNDCANLDNLEEIGCYGFVIASHDGSAAGTEVWVPPNVIYTGVTLSNVFYPFAAPASYSSITDIVTQLQGLSFGSSMTNFCTSSSDDGTADSNKSYIIFNTIPSIANNLELYGYTAGPNNGGGTGFGNVYFSHPCQLRSDIIAENHRDVCDCPAV